MWPAWSTRTRAADLTLHTARQVSGEAGALAIRISPRPGAEPVLGRFNDELAIPPVLSGSPPGNVSPALCLPSR